MAKRKQSSEDEDILADAKEEFSRIADSEAENRQMAIDSINFARKGDQWPEDIRKQRELEGRPILTINKLPAFIRQVVNDARQNKPSIKIRPVDSQADPDTAEVIAGLIRNIEYTSNADVAYDTAMECAVSGGVGYWRVSADYAYEDSMEMDIGIQRVANPFSVYGDPNSRAADSSDWDVAFVVDRLSKRQYERKYGEGKPIDWDNDAWRGVEDPWMEENSVQVAEYWTREQVKRKMLLFADMRDGKPFLTDEEGVQDEDIARLIEMGIFEFRQEREGVKHKVTQRIMSGAEILKTTDWPGCYIPIVPVYGDEFDIEGKRFFLSLVYHAMDAQRHYNYWRTNATELVALAPRVPYIGPKGAFDIDDGWNTANVKSHSYLEYAGQIPPQRQQLDVGPAVGSMQEALAANDDIKATIGMYDASLGQRSNETSGRAIMARQREGDVSTFHFLDNMSRAIRHTGRIIVDLIPKFYTQERIIRVLGVDGKEDSKQVNKPYPVMDPRTGEPQTKVVGRDPQTGLVLEEAVTAMHDLRVGKYDVAVDTGPSFTTRREEASIAMTEIVRAHPPAAQILAPEIVKLMDFPNAQDIAEKFEQQASGQLPPQAQKMMEEGKKRIEQLTQENAQMKMSQAETQAKLQADMQAEAAKLENEKQIEVMRLQHEREIAMLRVQTERDIALEKARIQAEVSVATVAMKPQPQPFRQPAE